MIFFFQGKHTPNCEEMGVTLIKEAETALTELEAPKPTITTPTLETTKKKINLMQCKVMHC